MKEANESILRRHLFRKKRLPFTGHLELTYRCNFDCVHCYCQGIKAKLEELTTEEWKHILDELQKEGCVFLVFSGGEPLLREDFLEIYSLAKTKGFLISIFTNGSLLTKEVVDYFAEAPPYSIEITFNGVTETTYDAVTRMPGLFPQVITHIKQLVKKNLPVILKTNCLKQNFHEVAKVKAFAEKILGRPPAGKYNFKYDPMIYPRLNGDTTPCDHRLSLAELLKVKKQDPAMWNEFRKTLHQDVPDLPRESKFLYHCDSWMTQFFINPYGTLKFCEFSEKFSSDLRKISFHEGFYKIFPRLLQKKFVTNSPCRDCQVRRFCHSCPARTYLETGKEEGPVPYYCALAQATAKEMATIVPKEKTEE
jgi:radical SAM protein with 4Fe4S-binding SPASM domain